LKRAKKILPYIDIGEANRSMARAIKTNKKKRNGANTAPDQGKEDQPKRSARFLAPARIQSFPSPLILCMTTDGREDLLLKPHLFLFFQISQVMSVIAERKPFGEKVVVFETASQ
jgi:hypothetical protein